MKYSIVVKTSARRAESVQKNENGVLVVTTRSRPINGAANKFIISLLSDYLNIPKTKINIISGSKSKQKIIETKDN